MKKEINKIESNNTRRINKSMLLSLLLIISCALITYFSITESLFMVLGIPSMSSGNFLTDISYQVRPYVYGFFITAILFIAPIMIGNCWKNFKNIVNKKIVAVMIFVMALITVLMLVSITILRVTCTLDPFMVFPVTLLYSTITSIGILASLLYGLRIKDSKIKG